MTVPAQAGENGKNLSLALCHGRMELRVSHSQQVSQAFGTGHTFLKEAAFGECIMICKPKTNTGRKVIVYGMVFSWQVHLQRQRKVRVDQRERLFIIIAPSGENAL